MKHIIYMLLALGLILAAMDMDYNEAYGNGLELPIHDRPITMADCRDYQRRLSLFMADPVATVSQQHPWARTWRNYCVFRDAPLRPGHTQL